MARPRRIRDEQLIDAAAVVIGQRGPGFTLAQVADQAGVSVGTVGQRFRSKHGLLLALSRRTTRQVTDRMRQLAYDSTDAVGGLRAASLAVYEWLGDAETAGNHLGQLGVDLADGELRALLGEHFAAIEEVLVELARDAVEWLPAAPRPECAARVLLSVVNGVSLDWSIRPAGGIGDRLREEIDAVLHGWERHR